MTQAPQTPVAHESRGHAFLRVLLDWVKTFIIALLIVFLLSTFVFQIIGVDGPSMLNTLHDRERMLVTKFEYLFHDPQRFDVVICNYPGRGNTRFVKRIVGVPGDVVAMKRGVLYVNGEPIEEDYIDTPAYYAMAETVVEEGHYFVLGDNRGISNDSHVPEVGQLTRKQILGKVRAVVWPLSDIRAVH